MEDERNFKAENFELFTVFVVVVVIQLFYYYIKLL